MNRRTGGIFVAPLLVTALFAMLSYEAPWRGEWNWTVDAVTGTTVLTGPLTGSVAAHIAAVQRRLDPVNASTVRGWEVPLWAGLRAWLLGLGVYVITFATAWAVTALSTDGGPMSWWVLLIGPAVLALCAVAGASCGWWWPHRLAVLFTAPALFLFGSFGPRPLAGLLRQGPVTGSLAGLEYDARVWWLQVGALVAATALIASTFFPWRLRRARAMGAVLAIGTAVLLISTCVALKMGGSERFVVSAERPTACRGVPEACLAPSNLRLLDEVSRALTVAADILRETGVDLPERYEQLLAGYHPPADVGLLADVATSSTSELRRGALLVVTPAACQAWTDPSAPPPDLAFRAQELLTEWIVGRGGGETMPGDAESATWLSQTNAPDRIAWVVRTVGQLRHCQLSELAMPWGVGS